jgi:hypothetical protein
MISNVALSVQYASLDQRDPGTYKEAISPDWLECYLMTHITVRSLRELL